MKLFYSFITVFHKMFVLQFLKLLNNPKTQNLYNETIFWLWFVANDTYSQTPQPMLGLINFLYTEFPNELKFHPNHSLYIPLKLLPSCIFRVRNVQRLPHTEHNDYKQTYNPAVASSTNIPDNSKNLPFTNVSYCFHSAHLMCRISFITFNLLNNEKLIHLR